MADPRSDETLGRSVTRKGRGDLGIAQLTAAMGVVALLGGGLVAGYAGQQVVSGGGGSGSTGTEQVLHPGVSSDVVVFDCPRGAVVGVLNHGDRVLASAVHDEVDGWVRVRDPELPARELWLSGSSLASDSDLTELPEIGCGDDAGPTEDELALGPPVASTAPTGPTTSIAVVTTTTTARATTSTSTTASSTPTTSPTTTTTTTTTTTSTTTTSTTTEPPDSAPPTIGTIGLTAGTIWENQGACIADGGKPKTSNIAVGVSDDDSGISSVTMLWSISGGGGSGSKPMSLSSGFWRATLGPFFEAAPSGGSATITVSIRAEDNEGNIAQKNASVTINDCTFG